MSVSLATVYAAATDELFKTEAKIGLVTNRDYDWTGAHSVKVWKISTAPMVDYARNVSAGEDATPLTRYGALVDLNAATEEMILSKDRSFIFNVDKLDTDETNGQLEAGTALARQLREVVVPEIDTYCFGKMVTGAGTTVTSAYSAEAVYESILLASQTLDDNEIPETGRVLIVTPEVYTDLKKITAFDNTDVGAELRLSGVVGILDGATVVKVPAARLPERVKFILCHPSATCAPVKLEDYNVHSDTVLSSGDIVTGRVCYDAFVLDNKAEGIYVYRPTA